MFLLLWFWQGTMVKFAYRTIPYSEFKERLKNGDILECTVQESSIEGRLKPNAEPAESNPNTNTFRNIEPRDRFFRTVRVEDASLVGELEKAKVKFHGERPS